MDGTDPGDVSPGSDVTVSTMISRPPSLSAFALRQDQGEQQEVHRGRDDSESDTRQLLSLYAIIASIHGAGQVQAEFGVSMDAKAL